MWKKIKKFVVISFLTVTFFNILVPTSKIVASAVTNDSIYSLKESELQDIENLVDKYEVVRLEPDLLEKFEATSFSIAPMQTRSAVSVQSTASMFLVKLAEKAAWKVIEALVVKGIDAAWNAMGRARNGSGTDRSNNITITMKSEGSVTFNPNNSNTWVWQGRAGMDPYYIRLAQSSLKSAGYYFGSVDGLFGPASDTATKNFQTRKNLTRDGQVGPATWKKLAHE